MSARPLVRSDRAEWAAPPVRIVHLGLGAFFRAHQAVYTAQAPDAADWGIAAFSGRSRELAERLAAQDGLYTLTVREPDTDRCEVVPSLVAAHPGTDHDAWRRYLASPQVGVLTLTVTEAAYQPGPGSVLPRLVDGLAARRRADAGPIVVVPCDNVADNAGVLGRALIASAERTSTDLAEWIERSVHLVGTVVDRITPRPTDLEVTAAARQGWVDAAPVVTEPFSEWILSVPPTAGPLPDWPAAGAVRTDDLGPYARRKLHLLNGAHSLLAYAGSLRGHPDVAAAVADPVLAEAVQAWWDEAARSVGGDPDTRHGYQVALLERFANPRMHHQLAQIAVDGSVKLPVRIVPVARTVRAAGDEATASATVLGAWVAHARRVGAALVDARADAVARAVDGPLAHAVPRAVALLDPELAEDREFLAAVTDAAGRFTSG